jgi:hypothetical protein
MRRADHPFLAWVIDHMMLLYIAVVVTAILPIVIVELTR